jgi:glycine oxidase
MDIRPAPRVVVAGAGVFGLCIALALLRRGMSVTVVDPAPEGLNASTVAAGLLAPIGEAVFDPDTLAHFPLLSGALDCWDDFAAAFGVEVAKSETLIPREFAEAVTALGGMVAEGPGGLAYIGDRRVATPPAALAGLRNRVSDLGGQVQRAHFRASPGTDWTVLAVGPGSMALSELAPELSGLTPVKGQMALLPRGPSDGAVHRWPGGYLVPQVGGARAGATMEPGRSDVVVDPDVITALSAAAAAHVPGLDIKGAYGLAGVRMASPDGLPLVGPSITPEVLIAAGARRNGWLLAPLVAEIIAAYVMGEDPGPWATMLYPDRFDKN